jgi:ribosomal protein S20
MTGLDSLSKVVLANVKMPSEHAEYIAPFLRKIDHTYGSPLACVHDMGTGICKAVAEVFPDRRDFICHFHFLRDLGKDFLEPAYQELRNRLRKHATSSRLRVLVRETRQRLSEQSSESALLAQAIRTAEPPPDTLLWPLVSTYSLALWALQGKHSGDGYGFPFDRPLLQFTERLLELAHRLPEILELFLNDDRSDHQPLFKLARQVSDVAKDPVLYRAVEELRWRSQIFDALRQAMRIAPPGGANGLNDDGTAKAMSTIRQGVEQFRRELEEDRKLAADPLSRKMGEQIDKYADKLFADPIEVDTPTGKVTIYPQRTNNILEQFFRGLRRGHRRKTGNNSMRRALQTMLADTPLVKNLDNPDYMEILLDGQANLEELFAHLTATSFVKAAESEANIDHLLPGFRAIIKMPTLPEQVVRLFTRPQ